MSGRIHIKDQFGNDMLFGHAGDVWVPQFPMIPDYRQHMKDILNLELRSDDIMICGYPKSGIHWNHEIIHMLVHGAPEYVGTMGYGEMLDATTPDKILPPVKPRVFFTHFRFHHLPLQLREKKVKIVYLTRNPKDQWVSLYNHVYHDNFVSKYEGTWDQFFEVMMSIGYWYGDWFDHALDWEKEIDANKDIPVFISNFEDLKKDLLGQVQKLNDFLGLKRSKEVCQQIAEACRFPALKAAKDAQTPEDVWKTLWKENAPGFYRKGEVGDWKNWFSAEQSARFDAEFEKRMAGSKLKFTYE